MYLLFASCPVGKTLSKNTEVKKEDTSNALDFYTSAYYYKPQSH